MYLCYSYRIANRCITGNERKSKNSVIQWRARARDRARGKGEVIAIDTLDLIDEIIGRSLAELARGAHPPARERVSSVEPDVHPD